MIAIWSFFMRRVSEVEVQVAKYLTLVNLRHKCLVKESLPMNFDNVAGLQEAKEEVREIVDFLENPKIYCNG